MRKYSIFFCLLWIWGVMTIAGGGTAMHEPRILPVVELINDRSFEINLDWYRIPYQNLEVKNPGKYPLQIDLENQLLTVQAIDAKDEFLGEITLYKEDKSFDIFMIKRYIPEVSFCYIPANKKDLPTQVFLVGDFNGWNQHADPMKYDRDRECFTIDKFLTPHWYSYKFVVNGQWLHDSKNPERESDGHGGYNSRLLVEGQTPMKGKLIPRSIEKNRVVFEKSNFKPAWNRLDFKVMLDNTVIEEYKIKKYGNKTVSYTFPCDITESRLLRILAFDQEASMHPTLFYFQVGKGLNYDPDFDWRSAVMYYAVTDRFYDGNPKNNQAVEAEDLHPQANFKGGDFEGIQKKIQDGYFEKLGIDILWISPVLQNPWEAYLDSLPPHYKFTGYHGYWPIRPRRIEKRFGGSRALKKMVKTAHNNDMKVLVDFVASHVHKKHPYFKNNPEWFGTYELSDGRKNIRLFDEFPLSTWFDTFLPSFDYEKSEQAMHQMVNDGIWHLERFGFDGFRQDAVKHIPNLFWRELTSAMRRLEIEKGKNFYQIGETIDSRQKIKEYVNYGEMDGQFDFPLYWTIRDAFAWETAPLSELARSVKLSEEVYDYDSLMGVFLGNHDFPRFIAYCDFITPQLAQRDKELFWENPDRELENPEKSFEKMRNAFGFLFSLNGIPLVYYGDEIGLMGMHDPDNRRMMTFEWNALQKEMFEWVSTLIGIRKENPALWLGSFTPVTSQNDLLVFRKDYFDNHILVIINRFSDRRSVEIPIQVKRMDNLLGDETWDISDSPFSVTVEPRKPAIYKLYFE